jgi:16S rRNA (cytosine967-C5)-methyltransferase
VTEEGAYSNLALGAELSLSGLDARDRRLAAELTYGTLRRMRALDRAIGSAAKRPLSRIDPPTLAALRLGVYQLLFARVPPHAAVSETVALAEPAARGFVNAVLRRISAATDADAPVADGTGGDAEWIADRTGLTPWAVAELQRILPADEVEAAAATLAQPAGLSLRVNRVRSDPATLAAALAASGLDVAPGRHHPDVLLVPAASPADLPGFREGWFAVQDEASVLVGAALQVEPEERVLDVCAAPGGKAAYLAQGAGPGGLVVAADASIRRAALVSRTAARLGVRLRVLAQDGRSPALRDESFDAILVDAPCSGIGAARRRPELLWRVPKDRLSQLARLQVTILCGVAPVLRDGGRLVYSVCTFPRAETDAVVRAFLARRPDFVPAPVSGPGGYAESHRLWPHRHGTDGMFFAGFTRTLGDRG